MSAIVKHLNTFDAPSYLTTFLVPFAILSVIGYLIGLPFVISSVREGGFNLTKYDPVCESKGKLECRSPDKDVYNDCVRSYTVANCQSTTEKSGKWAPIVLYILLPAVISSVIAFGIYQLMIFIKNPKVAAGYFLARGIFKN